VKIQFRRYPNAPVRVYPAEHGFNNWHRPSTYDEASADLARERMLACFATYVAAGAAS
jgi:dienelactone hydrolase